MPVTTGIRPRKSPIDPLDLFLRQLAEDAPGGILLDYWFKPGITGGFSAYMRSTSAGSGFISSTRHATKGFVYLGSAQQTAYNETAEQFGIKTPTPAARLELHHTTGSGTQTSRPYTTNEGGTSYDDSGEGTWPANGAANEGLCVQSNDGDSTYIRSHLSGGSGSASDCYMRMTNFMDPGAYSSFVLTVVGRKEAGMVNAVGVVIYTGGPPAPIGSGTILDGTDIIPTSNDGTYQTYTWAIPSNHAQTIAQSSEWGVRFRFGTGEGIDGIVRITEVKVTGPSALDSTPLQRWSNVSSNQDLNIESDGASASDLAMSGPLPLFVRSGSGSASGIRLYADATTGRIEAGSTAQANMIGILSGNRASKASSWRIAADGVTVGDAVPASLGAPTALLDLYPQSATTKGLRVKSRNVADTGALILAEHPTDSLRMFQVDPSGTVTVGDTGHADSVVRFQVLAPSTQAANIQQIVRAFAGGNYTAQSVGSTGSMVLGDTGTNGQGVTRLQINQGSGQTVDVARLFRSSAGLDFILINSAGQLRFTTDAGASPLRIAGGSPTATKYWGSVDTTGDGIWRVIAAADLPSHDHSNATTGGATLNPTTLNVKNAADTTKQITFDSESATTGAVLTLRNLLSASRTYSFATVSANCTVAALERIATWTAQQTFDPASGAAIFGPNSALGDFLILRDSNTSFDLSLSIAGDLPSNIQVQFPNVSGSLANSASQNIFTNKGFTVNTVGGATACHFRDGSSAGKRLYIVTSGSSINTNNSLQFVTTAARIYTFRDTAGGVVVDSGAALTSGRVPFATTGGALTDDADMTFATDTLTVTKIVVGAGASVAKLDHGTYTPTLTNVTNVSASTAYQCQYMRVGNTVTVSGKVDVDPTLGSTASQLGISLPIASNLGAQEDCAGTSCASGIASLCAAIRGDATNDRAEMAWVGTIDPTNQPWYFTFTYEVI